MEGCFENPRGEKRVGALLTGQPLVFSEMRQLWAYQCDTPRIAWHLE